MPVQVEIIIRVCPWGVGPGSGFIFFNMRRTGFEVFILFSSVFFESMLSGSAQYSTCCQEHATMNPRLKMQRKRWVSTLVLCGCKWFQAYGVNTELLRNMASKNKNMYRNNQTSWKSAWHKTTRHTKHEHHHQQQSLKHLHPQKTNFMKPLKGFIFGKGNIIVHPLSTWVLGFKDLLSQKTNDTLSTRDREVLPVGTRSRGFVTRITGFGCWTKGGGVGLPKVPLNGPRRGWGVGGANPWGLETEVVVETHEFHRFLWF